MRFMLSKTPEQMRRVAHDRAWYRNSDKRTVQDDCEAQVEQQLRRYRQAAHRYNEPEGYRTHFIEVIRTVFPWLVDLVALPQIFVAQLYTQHQANGWGKVYLGVVILSGEYLSGLVASPTHARKFPKSSEIQELIQRMIQDVK